MYGFIGLTFMDKEQRIKAAASRATYAVNPWFLLTLMLLTSGILMIIIRHPMTVFETTDPDPFVVSLTPQKAMEFGGMPARVDVGMFIHNFPEFDIVQGIFTVDVIVWFRFDPELVSLDRIEDFKFDKASVVSKRDLGLKLGGVFVIASFDMRIKFNAALNYDNFPLDDHRLNFALSNDQLSPSDATFHSSRTSFIISSEAKTQGWKYVDKQVKFGYSEDKLDPLDKKKNIYHPRVVFSIDYERAGTRYLISIFLPLLLVFFIALFSFAFDPVTASTYNVVSMSTGAITALIAYRFVIENMSPSVGYFMLSDYIFIYFLIATCIILACNMFGVRVSVLKKKILVALLNLATILLVLYLLNPWK